MSGCARIRPWSLDTPVVLVVQGVPGPQGSKSVKGRTRTGRTILVESSKKVKPWREAVALAAWDLVGPWRDGYVPLDGPLTVRAVFTLRKPLRPVSAFPDRRPDLSKLIRSTEDALTGILWADDARVVEYERLAKVYVGSGDPEGLYEPGVVLTVKGAS